MAEPYAPILLDDDTYDDVCEMCTADVSSLAMLTEFERRVIEELRPRFIAHGRKLKVKGGQLALFGEIANKMRAIRVQAQAGSVK